MQIKDHMIKNPIKAELPGSREEVLRQMVKNKMTGLPVVKRDTNQLVGFIRRQDIFSKPDEMQLAILVNKMHPTITPDEHIDKAAEILHRLWIHNIPVVDEGNLVGLVTPTDLMKIIVKKKIDRPVSEFMTSSCVPVYEEMPLKAVLKVIRLSKMYALPVLNRDAELTGIVTDRDVFNLTHINSKIAISDLGLGDDEDSWTWEGLRNVMKLYYVESKIDLPPVPVREIMVKDPKGVYEGTSITEAAKIMINEDFGQIIVKDSDDDLVGVLYETDVMAALYDQDDE
jgi:CBS domain-containing protein